MELRIESNCAEDMCSLIASGEIDVSNADELRVRINQLIDKGVAHIDIDFEKVPYIDSTGIGVLMGAAHRVHEQGNKLTVFCPHENILRVLHMLGVDSQIEIRKER